MTPTGTTQELSCIELVVSRHEKLSRERYAAKLVSGPISLGCQVSIHKAIAEIPSYELNLALDHASLGLKKAIPFPQYRLRSDVVPPMRVSYIYVAGGSLRVSFGHSEGWFELFGKGVAWGRDGDAATVLRHLPDIHRIIGARADDYNSKYMRGRRLVVPKPIPGASHYYEYE